MRFIQYILPLSLVFLAFDARAEGHRRDDASLRSALSVEARSAYDDARVLFEKLDRASALAKFELAYKLSGDPRLLWNIAVCEKELRHYSRAITVLEAYSQQVQGNQEQLARANAAIDGLRGLSSVVVLRGLPDGDGLTVSMDGVALDPGLREFRADVGEHVLSVTGGAFRDYLRKLHVHGGAPLELEVALMRRESHARLLVESDGTDDVIRLDGRVVGVNRWSGEVHPGIHRVLVSAPRRESEERVLSLSPEGPTHLHFSLRSESDATTWLWLGAAAAAVAGGVVTTYLLSTPSPEVGPVGSIDNVTLRFN